MRLGGFDEAIDKSVDNLTNSNIAIMWKYNDGKWQTTYAGTLPSGITQMSDVKAGEGVWVLVK
ncbi:MAG: hypothetical protein IE909_18115 [Campylobacterales bacterium]|nr:hypothetical protein [Campylobacterales bacterium]